MTHFLNAHDPANEPLRVIIVDDHPFFRLGAKVALGSAPDVEVVADFESCEDAIQNIQELRPDVVLMDISFQNKTEETQLRNGIDATRVISRDFPTIGIIILTSLAEDNEAIFLSMQAGARGYIKKGSDLNEVLMAIHAVAQGGTFFGSDIARRIKDFFADSSAARRTTPDPMRPFPDLTDGEFKTLNLLAQGYRNPEIALMMGLAEKTIRNYVSSILGKLQVRDRLQAALIANKAGLGRAEE